MCLSNPANVPDEYCGFKLMAKAFAKYYLIYRLINNHQCDLSSFFDLINQPTIDLISLITKEFEAVKYYFNLEVLFHEEISDRTCKINFASGMFSGLIADRNENALISAKLEFEDRIDQFTQRGSGWILSNINHIDLLIGKYIPHAGGCNSSKLPPRLKNKKCLISPDCSTDCFMYSILIGLHKTETHCGKISNYTQFIKYYDFSMVRGMVSLNQIPKFERANHVSVNVYTYAFETERVCPLKVSKIKEAKHVNLFLHGEHYYFISDLSRLANSKKTRSRFICENCLNSYRLKEQLEKHKSDCGKNLPQAIKMPDLPHAICKRSNFRKEVEFPFCIYADFETLSVKRDDYSHVLTDLVPCSYGYVVVDWCGKIIHSDFYLGEDAGKKFLISLKSLETFLDQELARRRIYDHNLSAVEEEDFNDAINCHICHKILQENRVRDHNHLTGEYRGAAHQQCNLEYRVPNKYPVVFHNLKNFDGHIIISALDINFSESYIGFFLGKFKFVDSFAFLPSSLDNLSSNIPTESKNQYLKQVFGDIDTSLLLKKSALPYEYLTSLQVFNERFLPDISAFQSTLSDSNISAEMYDHLKHVWSKFNCSTLKDLHDIYLKVDVLLLTAVFENFRSMALQYFSLDPLHQFSAPGLTWSAFLKLTKVEIELFTSVDMFLFIEKAKRGGLTMVTKRHVKANNKYLSNYDPTLPNSYLLYLDVNNLYGYAMSQRLPISDYKWCSLPLEHIIKTDDNSDIGYILEVDLEYPDELHDKHNDFPLAPEKLEINQSMYSRYQSDLMEDLKQTGFSPVKSAKLTTNFYKKERYVVHYRTLKFYLTQGLKVTKVHRVVQFKQSAWLAEYVEFCTLKRQAAKSDFERDFWKLLVNSIYGKTIEDKRNHRNIVLALRDIEAQRHLRKAQCKKFMILGEEKMLFWMQKMEVLMDKPIIVGFSILELAKLKMYEIHYNTFKPHYQENINLVYTDTDSLIYEIKTDDIRADLQSFPHYQENINLVYTDTDSLIYEIKTDDIRADLQSFAHIMDFSNYPKDHPLYSNIHNKKIGYLKDEMGGEQIAEFVGIRPKLYALKTEKEIKMRAKGVPRPVLKNKITFQDYVDCLYDHNIIRGDTTRLQSDHHNIQMIQREKVLLSPLDDKRYWLNNLESLAYGHCKIKKS
uniref:DNA-directed DNA polymerase n=1 Tax=Tetranychus urticae TaxID=32264 RepID=T1JU36_TETUR